MEQETRERDAYFAASNSHSGFHSYFDECFDRPEIGRLYLVKGGPGTGKSRFLSEVGEAGERRGYAAEYILCSSDPASYDGLILKKDGRAIAFCDATSPHAREAKEPGLREEFINLGAFWNASILEAHKEKLRRLTEKKTQAYAGAYRYLSAAGEAYAESLALLSPFVLREEIKAAAEKFAKEIPTGKGYHARPAILSALGMDGVVRLECFFALAERRYLVEDCHDSASYFLAEVARIALERGQPIRVSHDPLLPERIDGLFFEGAGIALQVGKESAYPAKKIRMRRYVDVAGLRPLRGKINYAAQMKRALLGGALERLKEVKEAHFAIEEIYKGAMDFAAKEAFTKAFIQKLFDSE